MSVSNVPIYVDGSWHFDGRDTLPNINPATEAEIGRIAVATEADIDAACAAAHAGFQVWRKTPATDRAMVLHKAAGIIRSRIEEIAQALTRELGAPIAAARFEVLVASDVLDWSAGEARRLYGREIPSRFPGVTQIARLDPIGPVYAASPWNMPAIFPTRKMAEALAAGCSVIIKPAEDTPETATLILKALLDAGLPENAVSMLFGHPPMISERVLGSGIIRKLSFTGSVPVGKTLSALAAQNMVKPTMELGGHAPTIVFDDVDLDPVAELLAQRKARNAGQVCNSPTRFYVHEAVYEPFRDKLVSAFNTIAIGDPLADGTMMGPLVNERRRGAIEGLIEDALVKGARLAAGGQRMGNHGFFHELTLLDDVPDTADIMTVEPFGPLAALQPFSDIDDVIARSNALPYGLDAYAFSKSQSNLDRIADDLEVGLLGLNHCDLAAAETPFGGMKESGFGSEGGSEGVHQYLTTRFVTRKSA